MQCRLLGDNSPFLLPVLTIWNIALHGISVNYCWPSPTLVFMVSGAVGTHGQIFVPSKTTDMFENGVLFEARISVRVTLRLVVYRQSVRLGAKPLEAHDQRYIFWQLNPCGRSPYVTSSSLRRRWVRLLWIGFAFVKRTYHATTFCNNIEIQFVPHRKHTPSP
jgi:hypothetical protein